MTQIQARWRTSSYPSRSSASRLRRSGISPRSRGRTRVRNAAETRNVSASSANAQPAPSPSTSTVASAGPANSATVSIVLPAAFASWISSSGTVCGTSPVYAGRKNASAVPNSASMTTSCQISIPPVKISTASTACSANRIRSVTIITRWRGSRSAQTPPIRRKATSGSVAAASTIPTSVGEPMSVTYSASATKTIRSPIVLAAWPMSRQRKS